MSGCQSVLEPLELKAAFVEFEQASETLASFYASLERRVGELTDALSHSRAELERELQEKGRLATRLAALLDALPGGVVVLDGLGRVTQHNPAAVDLLGPIAAQERWVEVVARAFAPRWDDGHDVSLVDGRRVNVATEALAGEPGQILLVKDVSETRRLQEQLTHHRRLSAKTELAASLAHQVRTPLAVAMLAVGNLNRTTDGDARAKASRRALDAMRQLERLVEDMLSYARGGTLEMHHCRADSLLDRLAAESAQLTAGSEFEVRVDASVGDAVLCANASALHSIMLNLVNNSRHACGGHGVLAVRATAGEDRLICRFADDGPGIAPHARGHVFEPFFTTRANGTGLGLSVARGIARAHGGELELDETRQPGACFVLTLPLATCAAAEAAAPSAAAS